MTSAELRRTFLEFFRARGHEVVASSSLVPAAGDQSLLFTNAGMVQFKDVFTGQEQRPYNRATTSQRCVRAGGKHNDLENVGYTARHHTFFEMLGNFSFGDYFKREAIHYAWELLTEVWGLPADKLWVTVFEDDAEAAAIWLDEIKVDPERFSRIGAKDNFWAMGDTGPCGPCSEIFYDHGPEIPGGPPGSPDEDGDRYIEIWNLVFMQFERSQDGTMTPLPKPSVDTGMGLERLAAVLQGVHSNYEIDLFQRLIEAAQAVTGTTDPHNSSLRVIADHIRAVAFLIADGVLPDREGRGYVLRRILRRAVRHGHKLGAEIPFFHRLVSTLVAEMGEAYPELLTHGDRIEETIRQEEVQFGKTIDRGMHLLEGAIAGLRGSVIDGETAFKLYDTYGFPLDLTADIARERGLGVDEEGFEREMDKQRERSREGSQFGAGPTLALETTPQATEFVGYDRHLAETAIGALWVRRGEETAATGALRGGQEGIVTLEQTPFYGESGGQVGDAGTITTQSGQFQVEDTQKQGGVFLHAGKVVQGVLENGQAATAEVDWHRRWPTTLNHSATHLLHAALRQVLGNHVAQRGSLVHPERLRFDFTHGEPIAPADLATIERLVNRRVRDNLPVITEVMAYDAAIDRGAMALFGEKYGDRVRVVAMDDFSVELCGGTHVRRTGDIGLFKITQEGGVAAGVRRIEAITGDGALDWLADLEGELARIAEVAKGDRHHPEAKVRQLVERVRQLERETEQLKGRLASGRGTDLAAGAVEVDGVKVVAAELPDVDVKTLREAVDRLRQQLKSAVVILATVEDGTPRLVAGVTPDQTKRCAAGELVRSVAAAIGARGGGRADMAQAGGGDPTQLATALASVSDWVRQRT
ncbi:MAG: alanine--tRNA ligase [Candidatus Competibacterales bacterium]